MAVPVAAPRRMKMVAEIQRGRRRGGGGGLLVVGREGIGLGEAAAAAALVCGGV